MQRLNGEEVGRKLRVDVVLPGWDVHAYADRVNFGKCYYKLHRVMDWPYKILGKDHRMYFHDPVSASIIAQDCYPGDPNAVEAAYLHILLDQQCSQDPEYKKLLEKLALLDKRERRGTEKKKSQPPTNVDPYLDAFLKDLKKQVELRKWWRVYSNG